MRADIRPAQARGHLVPGQRAAGLWLLLLVNVLALARSRHPVVAIAVPAAVTIAYLFATFLFRSNARVCVEHDELRVTAWSGRSVTVPLHDVGGAARRTVTWPGFPPKEYLVIYDVRMHTIKRINTRYWNRNDLHGLVRALGRGPAGGPRSCTPAELNAEFSGAMSFWHRHNWLGGTLLAIAVATAIAVTVGR